MAITLKTIDGRLGTELADARGECFDYRVEVLAAPPPVVFALRLTRLDTEEPHVQELGPDGEWSCSCKDFEYRFRRNRSREHGQLCKHGEFAREFHALGLGGNPRGNSQVSA